MAKVASQVSNALLRKNQFLFQAQPEHSAVSGLKRKAMRSDHKLVAGDPLKELQLEHRGKNGLR
jgi:hypothetical protein